METLRTEFPSTREFSFRGAIWVLVPPIFLLFFWFAIFLTSSTAIQITRIRGHFGQEAPNGYISEAFQFPFKYAPSNWRTLCWSGAGRWCPVSGPRWCPVGVPLTLDHENSCKNSGHHLLGTTFFILPHHRVGTTYVDFDSHHFVDAALN